ncbi:hypothetical protein ACFWIQ_38100 [Kitasatospora sp. NPDC127059]|uniref:hypothetical protein n=1 Tax=unclassified Kitasatospora TaxID=2633591 RepID=UPI00364EC1C9
MSVHRSGLVLRAAVTLGGVVLFRLGQSMPLPGVDPAVLRRVADRTLPGDQLRGLADLVTGGGVYRLALLPFGVLVVFLARPLVLALTRLHPRLAALRPERAAGSRAGMRRAEAWTTLALGLLGGLALALAADTGRLLPGPAAGDGVLRWHGAPAVAVLTGCTAAGALAVLWLARWISRHGLGDGVSVLLLAQVLAVLPGQLWAVEGESGPGGYALVLAAVLFSLVATTALVIAGRRGERRVPVQYARRMIGVRSGGGEPRYLPLVLSHRGFVPAVAAALLLAPFPLPRLPYLALLFGLAAAGAWLAVLAGRSVLGSADVMMREGAFVPGIRPGRPTVEFLAYLRGRLAVAEVLGTGLVAVLPVLALGAVGAADGHGFSGASLLVAAGTALGAVGPLLRDVRRVTVPRRYAEYVTRPRP